MEKLCLKLSVEVYCKLSQILTLCLCKGSFRFVLQMRFVSCSVLFRSPCIHIFRLPFIRELTSSSDFKGVSVELEEWT